MNYVWMFECFGPWMKDVLYDKEKVNKSCLCSKILNHNLINNFKYCKNWIYTMIY